ncbi:hypothetical protein PR048_021181 [Dryococelus australis]|uniref:Uncharacterized protein n=1 Tax=Dryococelus australis TaxID=614101 RepID=A0ABQ9GXK6_9NEOP|nr:hypothetical protein PR048_021181 [Dryococelus australis]
MFSGLLGVRGEPGGAMRVIMGLWGEGGDEGGSVGGAAQFPYQPASRQYFRITLYSSVGLKQPLLRNPSNPAAEDPPCNLNVTDQHTAGCHVTQFPAVSRDLTAPPRLQSAAVVCGVPQVTNSQCDRQIENLPRLRRRGANQRLSDYRSATLPPSYEDRSTEQPEVGYIVITTLRSTEKSLSTEQTSRATERRVANSAHEIDPSKNYEGRAVSAARVTLRKKKPLSVFLAKRCTQLRAADSHPTPVRALLLPEAPETTSRKLKGGRTPPTNQNLASFCGTKCLEQSLLQHVFTLRIRSAKLEELLLSFLGLRSLKEGQTEIVAVSLYRITRCSSQPSRRNFCLMVYDPIKTAALQQPVVFGGGRLAGCGREVEYGTTADAVFVPRRMKRGEYGSAPGCKGGRNLRSASHDTRTCENSGVTPPGIEPCPPCGWGGGIGSDVTTTPPQSLALPPPRSRGLKAGRANRTARARKRASADLITPRLPFHYARWSNYGIVFYVGGHYHVACLCGVFQKRTTRFVARGEGYSLTDYGHRKGGGEPHAVLARLHVPVHHFDPAACPPFGRSLCTVTSNFHEAPPKFGFQTIPLLQATKLNQERRRRRRKGKKKRYFHEGQLAGRLPLASVDAGSSEGCCKLRGALLRRLVALISERRCTPSPVITLAVFTSGRGCVLVDLLPAGALHRACEHTVVASSQNVPLRYHSTKRVLSGTQSCRMPEVVDLNLLEGLQCGSRGTQAEHSPPNSHRPRENENYEHDGSKENKDKSTKPRQWQALMRLENSDKLRPIHYTTCGLQCNVRAVHVLERRDERHVYCKFYRNYLKRNNAIQAFRAAVGWCAADLGCGRLGFESYASRRRFSIGCRIYVEVNPFVSNMYVIGPHNCELVIYWRTVTRGVSRKAPSNDKRIEEGFSRRRRLKGGRKRNGGRTEEGEREKEREREREEKRSGWKGRRRCRVEDRAWGGGAAPEGNESLAIVCSSLCGAAEAGVTSRRSRGMSRVKLALPVSLGGHVLPAPAAASDVASEDVAADEGVRLDRRAKTEVARFEAAPPPPPKWMHRFLHRLWQTSSNLTRNTLRVQLSVDKTHMKGSPPSKYSVVQPNIIRMDGSLANIPDQSRYEVRQQDVLFREPLFCIVTRCYKNPALYVRFSVVADTTWWFFCSECWSLLRGCRSAAESLRGIRSWILPRLTTLGVIPGHCFFWSFSRCGLQEVVNENKKPHATHGNSGFWAKWLQVFLDYTQLSTLHEGRCWVIQTKIRVEDMVVLENKNLWWLNFVLSLVKDIAMGLKDIRLLRNQERILTNFYCLLLQRTGIEPDTSKIDVYGYQQSPIFRALNRIDYCCTLAALHSARPSKANRHDNPFVALAADLCCIKAGNWVERLVDSEVIIDCARCIGKGDWVSIVKESAMSFVRDPSQHSPRTFTALDPVRMTRGAPNFPGPSQQSISSVTGFWSGSGLVVVSGEIMTRGREICDYEYQAVKSATGRLDYWTILLPTNAVTRSLTSNQCVPATRDVQPIVGATVTERLARSPPTKAIRVLSPVGSLRTFACGNHAGRGRCSAGFLGDLPFPSALSFRSQFYTRLNHPYRLSRPRCSCVPAAVLRAEDTEIRQRYRRHQLARLAPRLSCAQDVSVPVNTLYYANHVCNSGTSFHAMQNPLNYVRIKAIRSKMSNFERPA